MSKHPDWTHREWEACKRMQAEGKTYKQIGAALGRTERGVKQKVFKMGYAGESAKERHRFERERLALAMLQRGIVGRQLCRMMGCDETMAARYKKRLTPILKGH